MNLGLVEIDLQGRVRYANDRYAEILGMKITDLLGQNIYDVLRVDDVNMSKLRNQLAKRKEGKSESYQIQMQNTKDETKYLIISGAPIYDDHGEVSGSLGVHLDVTEQKTLELHKEYL